MASDTGALYKVDFGEVSLTMMGQSEYHSPIYELSVVQPPPGLDVLFTREGVQAESPKPKVAYDEALVIQPPPGLTQKVPAKLSLNAALKPAQQTKRDVAADATGALTRFCVFCGKQVAPKLINSKFCVYCGNVHNGQVSGPRTDLPTKISHQFLSTANKYDDVSHAEGPLESLGTSLTQSYADEVGLCRSLAAYQDATFWQSWTHEMVMSLAAYDAAMHWQGQECGVGELAPVHLF